MSDIELVIKKLAALDKVEDWGGSCHLELFSDGSWIIETKDGSVTSEVGSSLESLLPLLRLKHLISCHISEDDYVFNHPPGLASSH